MYGSLRSACAGRKGGCSEFARASSPDVTDTHIEPCEAAQHAVSHGNLSAESRPRAGGAYSQRTGAPSRPGRFAGPYASGAVRGLPESSAGDINGDVDVYVGGASTGGAWSMAGASGEGVGVCVTSARRVGGSGGASGQSGGGGVVEREGIGFVGATATGWHPSREQLSARAVPIYVASPG